MISEAWWLRLWRNAVSVVRSIDFLLCCKKRSKFNTVILWRSLRKAFASWRQALFLLLWTFRLSFPGTCPPPCPAHRKYDTDKHSCNHPDSQTFFFFFFFLSVYWHEGCGITYNPITNAPQQQMSFSDHSEASYGVNGADLDSVWWSGWKQCGSTHAVCVWGSETWIN